MCPYPGEKKKRYAKIISVWLEEACCVFVLVSFCCKSMQLGFVQAHMEIKEEAIWAHQNLKFR